MHIIHRTLICAFLDAPRLPYRTPKPASETHKLLEKKWPGFLAAARRPDYENQHLIDIFMEIKLS